MSIYDSKGTEAFMLLGPDEDPRDNIKNSHGIWLNLAGLCFELDSYSAAVFEFAAHPPLRLFRLNVQGFAQEGIGEVKSVYKAHVLMEADVTRRAHLAGLEIADMALANLRKARKDRKLDFAGSCARVRGVKEAWIGGNAEPRYLRDLKGVCEKEANSLMWNERGSYNDPISHAIGAVADLASDNLELDGGVVLGETVRKMTNVVAVMYRVEELIGYKPGGELMEDRSGEMQLDWNVEPILRKNLLGEQRRPKPRIDMRNARRRVIS